MYIAAGQGQTTKGDKILMSTETPCHFGHLLQVLKKKLFKVWIYTFSFVILYMYIAPGQRVTTPWRRNFNVNRNILSLRSFVESLNEISLKSDFITFSPYFMHVYSRRSGAYNPRGQNFDVNRNLLSLCSFPTSFKKQGTKFLYQQKGLITLPICCKFQRNLFEVWFYTFSFSWFNTCI